LADRAWPQLSLHRDILLILTGALLVALCSRVEIPLRPVPITGQTFGVLLVGALLGSRRGAMSLLSYLALGAAGFPVFASGAYGPARFFGPTGGYLAGFVLAAALVGWLSERGWDRRSLTTILAMALGMLVIYACGVTWLAHFVGWGQVLTVGVFPFLLGDSFKIALAALALPLGWTLTGPGSQH
jgi:biotin transport system substrate-specific component